MIGREIFFFSLSRVGGAALQFVFWTNRQKNLQGRRAAAAERESVFLWCWYDLLCTCAANLSFGQNEKLLYLILANNNNGDGGDDDDKC